METKKALIIFAKNPISGNVKTRLAISIGEKKALEIYNQLLEIVFQYTVDLSCDKIVYWDGGLPIHHPFDKKIYFHKEQVSGDLGIKMKSAFKEEFKLYNKICIIGSDSVELTKEIIQTAFDSLTKTDIVIGPAFDGGYYLLGMNELHESLFEEIQWSTDKVLNQTYKKIQNLSLSFTSLQTLSDIDTVEDYNKQKNKFKSI